MDITSKIYVAGHKGLVGSAIVRQLKNSGYSNIISREYQDLNLIDQTDTLKFFQKEKPEYVFLAAAKVGGIYANSAYSGDFIYENLMIECNVINASRISGVKKLLFLGSSCIYPKLCRQPIKEEYLLSGYLEPTNEAYAIAKIAGLKLCQYFNQQYHTNFISVMPTNLYGPNDNYDLEKSHVLAAFIRKMHLANALKNNDWETIKKDLRKRPIDGIDNKTGENHILEFLEKRSGIIRRDSNVIISLWGSGNPRREFLHVDDLAGACVYLMENYSKNDFINIGTGEDLKIKELAGMIKKITGFDGKIIFDRTKPDGTPRKLLDVSRLHNLGWKHKISLEEGIRNVYQSYLTN